MAFAGSRQSFALAFALFAASLGSASAETRLERLVRTDGVAYMPDDDERMAAAMRKAQATLGGFLAIAADPTPSMLGFAIKVPLPTADSHEYVWLTPFNVKPDGSVFGVLANTPVDTDDYKQGETLAFPRSAVVDWSYIDGERMHGNVTACVLLEREEPSDAEAFKLSQGLVCDP